MDTGWIQVFVLTLAECVAPAGKTVCQQQEFELTFLTREDCQVAREQLVTLKGAAENVIVDESKTRCEATARRWTMFGSAAAAAESAGDEIAWREPEDSQKPLATVDASYKSRLEQLKSCDETGNVAPCKIGEIIIEDAVSGEPVEVWRQDKK